MGEKDSAASLVPEAEIVRRAQQGQKDAVQQLFSGHLATVHRFALRMCRDEERARDIAQESLLTALRSLDGYRGEASFSTWLFTIARSHCGKLRRRAEREAVGEDPEVVMQSAVSDQPAPDAQAIHGEVSDLVERALDSLDPSDREVLLLRDVEGLSTKQAAQVLEISTAALKSRLHRARATLRSYVRRVVDPAPEDINPSCPDVLAEFSKKLEGDLADNRCAALEAHIADCPNCAARCESIQKILGACAALRAKPTSPAVQRDLDELVSSYLRNRP